HGEHQEPDRDRGLRRAFRASLSPVKALLDTADLEKVLDPLRRTARGVLSFGETGFDPADAAADWEPASSSRTELLERGTVVRTVVEHGGQRLGRLWFRARPGEVFDRAHEAVAESLAGIAALLVANERGPREEGGRPGRQR